jgi:hypothetical protein
MILAVLLLLSGLTISGVAIYYSVMGLMAIFSAAAVPIAIMGVSLEVGKLVTASWIKAHWPRLPLLMKWYAITAVTILMIITSLGIFGFLSKAHSDQTLVSGDVQSKIAIYDEKIKTARENIEADRKQLRQMDEAVDQIMARSDSEKGAEKAATIRRSQQRDRGSLAKDIETNQVIISQLNDESAPVRAENRKVEAEVGPIKYIAAFVYGANPDASILERAVTWVIILIVVVFDPLAVVMLLAAQMTFDWIREERAQGEEYRSGEITKDTQSEIVADLAGEPPDPYVADVGEKPTVVELRPVPESDAGFTEDYPKPETKPEPKVVITPEEWEALDAISAPKPEYEYEFVEEHSGEDYVAPAELSVAPTVEEEFPDMERPGDYVTPPETVSVTIDGGVIEPARPIVREAAPARGRGVMHSHLEAQADNFPETAKAAHSGFGNEFPVNPNKGDVYLRTDYLPNRLFKFNGQKWIEVGPEQRDILAYDDGYIRHLVDEIESGRQDVDLLSDLERSQIAEFLSRHSG